VQTIADHLIELIVSPIISGIKGYEESVKDAIWTEILAQRTHHTISSSMEDQFWVNFTGGLFPLTTDVLTGTLVVITIVSSIGLGFSFVIPLLITFLLSKSDQSLGSGMKILHLRGVADGTALVPTIESGVNLTYGHPSTNNGSGSHPSQNETFAAMGPDWSSLLGDLFGLSGAILLLASIIKGSVAGAVGEATAGVVASALAMLFDGVIESNSSYCGLSVFSMILSFLGFALGFNAWEQGAQLPGEIALATSLTAATVSVYEYSKGC
jgi:hypothetical protein